MYFITKNRIEINQLAIQNECFFPTEELNILQKNDVLHSIRTAASGHRTAVVQSISSAGQYSS